MSTILRDDSSLHSYTLGHAGAVRWYSMKSRVDVLGEIPFMATSALNLVEVNKRGP